MSCAPSRPPCGKLAWLAISLFFSLPHARAATLTWDAGGGSGDWATAGNWNPDATPAGADTLVFDTSATTALNNNTTANNTYAYLFNAPSPAYVIGGNAVTLDGTHGIDNNSASPQTFNHPFVLGATAVWNASAGPLSATAAISGAGGLTKSGTSTLTLSGVNTYTGTTLVNGGLLDVTGGSLTGSGSLILRDGGSMSIANATFTQGGSAGNFTVGYQSGTGTVTVGSGGVLNVGNNGARTFIGGGESGGPYGAGILTLTAGSAVNIATPGTFPNDIVYIAGYGGSGTINLDGGVLTTARNIQHGAGAGPSVVNLNGGTLRTSAALANLLNASITTTNVRNGGAVIDTNGFNSSIPEAMVHSTIGGDNATDGGLTKNGAGVLTLSGANTFNGPTTVNAGTLRLVNNTSYASPATVIGGAVLEFNSTATNDGTPDWNYNRNLTGAGTVNKTGTGWVYWPQTITLSGQINVSDGILSSGNGTSNWSGNTASLNVASPGKFDLWGNNVTIGALTGNGAVANGSGASTYTLTVGSGNTSGSYSGALQNTSGALALTKIGTGTQTLTGANTHTGATTVSGGVLDVTAGSLNGTVSLLTRDGGSLSISNATVTQGSSASGNFTVGYTSGGGTVNVGAGGVLNIGAGGARTFVGGGESGGPFGNGTLNITAGGVVNAAAGGAFPNDKIYFGGYGGNSTINLTNGTLVSARDLIGANGTRIFNADAGTLRAGFSSTTFFSAMTSANLLAGGLTLDSNGFNITVSQVMAGSGPLVKAGAGTLTMTGNYTGGTVTVNQGILSINSTTGDGFNPTGKNIIIGSGGTLQYSGANKVQNNVLVTVGSGGTFNMNSQSDAIGQLSGGGTLLQSAALLLDGYNNPSTQDFSGTISGAGALTLRNITGTQILSGANTYTGLTTVNSGTFTLASTGSLNYGASGGLTVNGAAAVANIQGTVASSGSNVAPFTVQGGGVINFSGTGTTGNTSGPVQIGLATPGVFNMLGGSLTTTWTGANGWGIGNAAAGTVNLSGGTITASGDDVFLVGWSGATGAGFLNLSGTGVLDISGTAPLTVGNSGSSGTINLNSGGLLKSGRNIASGGGPSIFNFNGGTLLANAASTGYLTGLTRANVRDGGAVIDTGTFAITVGQALLHSNIGGDAALDGGLTKNGAATLTLSGASTYTGPTLINAGTLSVASLANGGATSGIGASTAAASNLVLAGGGLTYTGATATSDRAFTIANGATGTFTVGTGATSLTFSGSAPSTTGSLVKAGAGTLVLSGSNAQTGPTTISAGTLSVPSLPNGGVAGPLGASPAAAANLVLGGGTLQYTGATTSSDRGFTLTDATTSGFDVTTGGTSMTLAGSGAASTGGFNKTGPGTLILTGAHTHTGATTANGGTLEISGGGSLIGTTTLTTANGGTITINNATVTTGSSASGVFSPGYAVAGIGTVNVGSGGVLNVGAGGARTFVGGGNGAAPFGSGILNLTGNAVMTVATPGTFPNNHFYLAGYGGAGTVNLDGGTFTTSREIVNGSGSSSFFNFNGGTLRPGVNNMTLISSPTVANVRDGGAIFDTNGLNATASKALTHSAIGGDAAIDGGLTKNGAGILTLSGANTYTGPTVVNGGTLSVASLANGGATSGIGASTAAASNLILNNGTLLYSGATVASDRGFTLANGATGTIDVSNGAATLTLATTSPATSGGLTKAGAGTLAVSGGNPYTGATRINAGTLAASVIDNGGSPSSLGASPAASANLLLGGGTLAYTGPTVTSDRGFTLVAGTTSAINVPAATDLTFTGNIPSTTGGLTKNGAGTLTLPGTFVSTGALTSDGAGSVLNLTGSYTHTNTGSGGNVRASNGGVINFNGTHVIGGTNNGAIFASGGGTLNVLGGSLLVNYAANGFGIGDGSSGTLNISGGSVNVSNLNVFYVGFANASGAGNLTLSGTGALTLGNPNGNVFGHTNSSGTINLDGGTLTSARPFNSSGGVSTFNFNGGLLRAGLNSATFVQGLTTTNVRNGGVVIDTQSFNIGVPQNLLHSGLGGDNATDGGLTKSGAGALTLSGANTYTGKTTVNGGTLQVTSGNENTLGANPAAFTADQFQLNGGTLQVSTADLTLDDANRGVRIGAGGGTFNVDGGRALVLANATSGPGNLTKAGAGLMTVNGANAHTGTTGITGGTLQITSGNEASLGLPAVFSTSGLLLNGGTLQVSAADLSLNDANRGIAVQSSGGTFNVDGGRVLTVANAISGANGNLTKAGAGTVNLTGGAHTLASFLANQGTFQMSGGTLSAPSGLITAGATFRVDGGKLRVDSLTTNGGFIWGAATLTHATTGTSAPIATDHSSAGFQEVGIGRTATITGDLASSVGSTLGMHGSPTLYLSSGVRYNAFSILGSLNLSAADDTLEFDLNPYLLRPFSSQGIGATEYGSLPLVTWTGSLTGTFDNVTGIVGDSYGFQLSTFAVVDGAALDLNTYFLEYDTAAGTLFFHYKVSGYVPEPDTFALLALSVIGLRTARVLSDRRRRLG